MESFVWNEIIYNSNNSEVPSMRWGHKFVEIGEKIVMFGGFGGEEDGKYLNDLWQFDTCLSIWSRVKTTGDIPIGRSNYTMHYNQIKNQIVMFGGGSEGKARFNDICILNWNSKNWKRLTVSNEQKAPWERTYHTSELVYPYLIIFGGEGVSNLDLGDLWVYNFEKKNWTQINCIGNIFPSRRRFHSSAVINNIMYLTGGCFDYYKLLGDIYSIDLSNLIKNNDVNNMQWKIIGKQIQLLNRWGHTSNVYEEKIYFFGGRASTNKDHNDIFIYDPKENLFIQPNIENNNRPKERRRHSSAIIGNSLIIFAGFNGKYLRDFHYLTIKSQDLILNMAQNVEVVEYFQENCQKSILQEQQKIDSDFLITVKKGQIISILESNKQKIIKNLFFSALFKFSSLKNISIELPQFCSLQIFRLLHISILANKLVLPKQQNEIFYLKLLQSLQYFCCHKAIKAIQKIFFYYINLDTCLKYLEIGIQYDLKDIQALSIQTYLRNFSTIEQNGLKVVKQIGSQEYLCEKLEYSKIDNLGIDCFKKDHLKSIFNKLKFSINQEMLRQNKTGLLSKAAKKMKTIFVKQKRDSSVSRDTIDKPQHKEDEQAGCFNRILNFFRSFSKNNRVAP